MQIREATLKDNQQLIKLQQKCPIGSDLQLQLDSSHSFFNRSKGYKDWTVIVAEENNQIIGSAGYALQEKHIQGLVYKAVYEYGFMVDPDMYRKGIASKMQESVEQKAIDSSADFLHLNFTKDNLASHSLFTKHGFIPVRECSPLMFIAFKNHHVDQYNIRPMKYGDIPVVVDLLNEFHSDYDFYTPFTESSFTEYYERLPFFSLKDIFIFEHDTVKAVAGYWDYKPITRFTLQSYNTHWKIMSNITNLIGLLTPMPKLPKIGEQMTNWYLTPFAYRDPEAANQLLRHILNRAFKEKVSMVSLQVDKRSPVYSEFDKNKPNKGAFNWYIKPLKNKNIPEINRIYIDALDI